MNKSMTLVAVLTVMSLATASAMAGGMKFPAEKVPVMNVPKMATPPKCDGVIGEKEWANSVKVMGVVSTHSLGYKDRPISFRVAWDDEHLYIAAASDILPGHRLWRQRRDKYSVGVVYDDAYEFGIFMHGRNQVKGEASSFQKLVINSLKATEYMKLYPSIGQNMYNWQPDPKIGSRVYKADGKRWWALEMAFNLKDLQMPVKHAAGDRVDMLLAADLKNPKWQWLDFPSASGHLEHYGFPRLTLTDTRPYIQVHRIAGLHDEKLDFKSTITNPGRKPVTVEAVVKARYNAPPKGKAQSKQLFNVKKTLTIAPGQTVRLDVARSFPGLKYERRPWGASVNVSALAIVVKQVGDEKAPLVYNYRIRFNPAGNRLEVIGDTLDAKIPAGSKPASLGYIVTKDGKAVDKGTKTLLVNLKYEGFVDLPDLKPGKYHVKLALLDKAGKELIAKTDLNFEKKDEAKVFAAWWNNSIGDTKKVLKPFTAIKVAGDKAEVTRRVYTLDSLGLPRQIVANGGAVLTAPSRILLTVGGKEYVVPTQGTVTYTSKKDYRTEFTGASEIAGVSFAVKGSMEQDGLVNLDVTYAPAGKAVAIEDLRVEWPVDGSEGSWMHCIGGVGGNYAPRTIGKVPGLRGQALRRGSGQVWDCLTDIGKMGSKMVVGNWQNNLWVGNDRRGLCWFGDHDKGWVPTEKTPAHSLYRDGKAVIIRNHIIQRPKGEGPFVLKAPRTINLQYNATPFRHLARGFRLTQVSACNGFSRKGSGWDNPGFKWDVDKKATRFTTLSMPSADKAKWPRYLAYYKKAATNMARTRVPFAPDWRLRPYQCNQIALRGYARKTQEPGMYEYFGADWATQYDGESLNKTYRDYMIYLMDMHVREGGLTHYYFDISFTRSTPALAAGFGYRLPNGKVQPTSMDGPLREWYKRTWALMQEHDLYPGAVSGHATHSMPLRAMPWCDSQLDAEYPIKDASTVYTKDAMIAMSVPHTFGVNIVHHGHMDVRWPSLFDSSKGQTAAPFSSPQFRHFGIAAEDVAFLGFWRNGKIIRPADKGMLVSAWKRPGKVVLQAFNYGLDPAGQEQTRSAQAPAKPASLEERPCAAHSPGRQPYYQPRWRGRQRGRVLPRHAVPGDHVGRDAPAVRHGREGRGRRQRGQRPFLGPLAGEVGRRAGRVQDRRRDGQGVDPARHGDAAGDQHRQEGHRRDAAGRPGQTRREGQEARGGLHPVPRRQAQPAHRRGDRQGPPAGPVAADLHRYVPRALALTPAWIDNDAFPAKLAAAERKGTGAWRRSVECWRPAGVRESPR